LNKPVSNTPLQKYRPLAMPRQANRTNRRVFSCQGMYCRPWAALRARCDLGRKCLGRKCLPGALSPRARGFHRLSHHDAQPATASPPSQSRRRLASLRHVST